MFSSFFAPIADENVPPDRSSLVAKWCEFAEDLEYAGPVFWQVKVGFTIKEYASKAGSCYLDFKRVLFEKFENNEPTPDAAVFFIPRTVATVSTVKEQMKVLRWLRKSYRLPKNHCASFGKATLILGLIEAHLKHSGERVPLDGGWVRTDTVTKGGSRVALGTIQHGLICAGPHYLEDDRSDLLGVFPLGVELGR